MSTANAMPEQISACLAAGMDMHVAKPIDIKSLYAAIETAMARGATMPADLIAV